MTALRRVVTVTSGSNPVDAALVVALAELGVVLSFLDDDPSALLEIGRAAPDLVIVPTDITGAEPLSMVDAVSRKAIPVLVALSHHPGASTLAVDALECGAAAIIGLPLRPGEVANALARHALERADVLRAGDLMMDLDAYRVTVRGHNVPLSAREFALLRRLLESPRHLVSLEELEELAESEAPTSVPALRVMIARIRRKLEHFDPNGERLVETVRGVGYRITAGPNVR